MAAVVSTIKVSNNNKLRNNIIHGKGIIGIYCVEEPKRKELWICYNIPHLGKKLDAELAEVSIMLAENSCEFSALAIGIGKHYLGIDAFSKIMQELSSNTTVTSLKISGEKLENDYAKIIAQVLTKKLNINSLTLTFQVLDEQSIKTIADGLKSCVNLQAVEFAGSMLKSPSFILLAESLAQNTSLKELTFDADKENENWLAGFQKILNHNKQLTSLTLTSLFCSHKFTLMAVEYLKHTNCLLSLKITCDDFCAEKLSEALQNNRQLKLLHVDGTSKSKSLEMLAKVIKTNLAITDFFMHVHDAPSVQAIAATADMLGTNRTLKVFRITCPHFVDVDNVSWKVLADVMSAQPTLTSLRLPRCKKSDLTAFCMALKSNTTLLDFYAAGDYKILEVIFFVCNQNAKRNEMFSEIERSMLPSPILIAYNHHAPNQTNNNKVREKSTVTSDVNSGDSTAVIYQK